MYMRITSRLSYCYYKPDRVRKTVLGAVNNIERITQIGTQTGRQCKFWLKTSHQNKKVHFKVHLPVLVVSGSFFGFWLDFTLTDTKTKK